MGCPWVDDQFGVFDQAFALKPRRLDRHDLVVVAMDDQGGDVEFLQVLAKVGFREGLDAVEGVFMATHHALHPESVDQPLGRCGAGAVEAEERAAGHVLVELRTVGDGAGTEAVEDFDWQALGVGLGFQHQWWHRRNQPGLGQALGAVPADIPGDFATAGGETEENHVVQVQMFDQFGEVVGVVIHVIAVPRLAGASVPPSIVSDGAKTILGKVQHL